MLLPAIASLAIFLYGKFDPSMVPDTYQVQYQLKHLLYFTLLFLATIASLLLLLQEKIGRHQAFLALGVIMAVDICIFAYNYNPSFDLEKRFPLTPGIKFLQDNTTRENILFVGLTLPPDIATYYKIHDLRCYDAMNKRDFTRDFQAAFQPEGTWQLINYLPDVADVTEKSSKYRFDIKYLAIGANKKIVPVARRKYNRSIVYDGPDFIIVKV